MSRQKQFQLRSRRNGLVIPIPAHNKGVIPRFGIEDNQMIFAPAEKGQVEPRQMALDDSPVRMGSADEPVRVRPGNQSTLAVSDAEASPVVEPTHEEPVEQAETVEQAEPVELAPEPEVEPKPTRARKAAKKAANKVTKATPAEDLA